MSDAFAKQANVPGRVARPAGPPAVCRRPIRAEVYDAYNLKT